MDDDSRLWHVRVTVAGAEQDASAVHDALRRLQGESPFLHSVLYDEEHAEVCYWEEGELMLDAASLALRMWGEHHESASLPDWRVVGLEVVERATFQARETATPVSPTQVRPRRFT
ncbi:MAG: hypothetical protein ACRDP4_04410 [Nocardioidaceae bacterium]